MNILAQKKCSVCKKEKYLDDFPKNKGKFYGRDSRCKRCNSDAVLKWQRENKEKVNKKNKDWSGRNKDKKNSYSKKWRDANPDKQRIATNLWAQEHREQRRKSVKNWQDSHPEQRLINQHNREAKRREVGGTITISQWRELKEKYENKCLRCEKPGLKLTLDHIVPLSKGGRNVIENAQPLCGPCNSIKATKIIDYRPKE